MIEQHRHELDRERRREAVRIGRRGIGRRLEIALEGVVLAPVPLRWLELLRAADERARAEDKGRRAG